MVRLVGCRAIPDPQSRTLGGRGSDPGCRKGPRVNSRQRGGTFLEPALEVPDRYVRRLRPRGRHRSGVENSVVYTSWRRIVHVVTDITPPLQTDGIA